MPVSDQDRALDFYVNTLGFDLLADNPMGPDQRWVQVGAPGGQTSMTLVTWFETMPAGSLRGLVIETDDLEADVEALAARGRRPSATSRPRPGDSSSPVDDPDGNGSSCRPRPAWPPVATEAAATARCSRRVASPARRQLLGLLLDHGPLPVQDLAAHFAMRRPSVSEHLRVLKDAGLVGEQPSGRQRYYHLEPRAAAANCPQWLSPYERFWRREARPACATLLDDASDDRR